MTPEGHHRIAGFDFVVDRGQHGWWVSFPGVDGVGAFLRSIGDDWVFDGGPLGGAHIQFTEGGGGLVGGVISVERGDGNPTSPAGQGLVAPLLAEDSRRDEVFGELWDSARGLIDWDLPYPKHQFVQWLMAREEVVFHGSNRPGIDVFRTARESVELDDPTGRGNLAAVYATPDGLWATYFAIVDRSRIRGSLRNGVATYRKPDGGSAVRYLLSLPSLDLERRPFAAGTLYMLPRERFAPNPLYPGGPPTFEWACPDPVAPLASLTMEPEDYPFLDLIGGHEETERVLYADAATAVYDLAVEVMSVEPDVMVRLSAEPPVDLAAAFRALGRVVWPGTERRFEGSTLTVAGPADYRAALASAVSDAIAGR